MRTLRYLVLSVTLAFMAALAAAQTPPDTAASTPRIVYVQDFEAHTGDAGGNGGGSSRRGPLTMLRGARASEKAVMSAGSLSGSIASEFKSRGYNSQRISREEALPKDGWLVTGIFYAINAQTGMIQMPSFISGKPDPINTNITVSVADLAKAPNAPFIVFGQAEALRGQGPPTGWNPYVVAAKFVVNTVESAADIQKLAKQIVDTILQNKNVVEEKAKAAPTSS
jgi:hypothetical protein